MELIDAEVLATPEHDVLHPSVVEEAVVLALEELSPARTDDRRDQLSEERARLEDECRRLAEAIGRGGPLV